MLQRICRNSSPQWLKMGPYLEIRSLPMQLVEARIEWGWLLIQESEFFKKKREVSQYGTGLNSTHSDVEAGEWQIQGLPWIQSEFKASLYNFGEPLWQEMVNRGLVIEHLSTVWWGMPRDAWQGIKQTDQGLESRFLASRTMRKLKNKCNNKLSSSTLLTKPKKQIHCVTFNSKCYVTETRDPRPMYKSCPLPGL